MVVLGGGAVSYERGTPVPARFCSSQPSHGLNLKLEMLREYGTKLESLGIQPRVKSFRSSYTGL